MNGLQSLFEEHGVCSTQKQKVQDVVNNGISQERSLLLDLTLNLLVNVANQKQTFNFGVSEQFANLLQLYRSLSKVLLLSQKFNIRQRLLNCLKHLETSYHLVIVLNCVFHAQKRCHLTGLYFVLKQIRCVFELDYMSLCFGQLLLDGLIGVKHFIEHYSLFSC